MTLRISPTPGFKTCCARRQLFPLIVTIHIASSISPSCRAHALQPHQQTTAPRTATTPAVAATKSTNTSDPLLCASARQRYKEFACGPQMAGQRVAAFAWQLQQQVAEQNAAADAAGFFLSPISLYIALGLALSGSGSDSSTQQELYHLLHQDKSRLLGLVQPKAATGSDVQELIHSISQLSSDLKQQSNSGSAEMILANGLWTNTVDVRAEYAGEMLKLFQAEVKRASSVDVINKWAEEVTKGLIKQAIPPGTPFDLVLTNAVYFKGLWEYAFKKESTNKQSFTLAGGPEVQVDMMSKTFKSSDMPHNSAQVKYAQTSSYQAVRLPYKGSTVSAVIVLPRADLAKHGVAAAVAKLDIQELIHAEKYQRVGPGGLIVHLPRFKVQTESVSLKKHLLGLGVHAAFDKKTANFSKLSETELYISDVLQSVCVIVDEEGTEAAAVTSVVMMRCAAVMAQPVTIKFDRPFLFMLVDDATSTPLFVGTVTDPSNSG